MELFAEQTTIPCLPAVTYNTLIDVHGKMGRWEQALQVVGTMKQEVGVFCRMLDFKRAAQELDLCCCDSVRWVLAVRWWALGSRQLAFRASMRQMQLCMLAAKWAAVGLA